MPTTCPTTASACTRSCFSGRRQKRSAASRTLDIAKRLIDYGFHPPTIYFPLIVEEALMIEPTETESDRDARPLRRVMHEIADEPHGPTRRA